MQQANILVADDSRTIRSTVRRTLVKEGWDVTLASNGKEAVELARRDEPDLVILDIHMPRMDGYNACIEILEYMDIPVIFLTTETAKHLEAMGDRLGAYLPKPADAGTLVATVQALLDRHAVLETR